MHDEEVFRNIQDMYIRFVSMLATECESSLINTLSSLHNTKNNLFFINVHAKLVSGVIKIVKLLVKLFT